MQEQYTRLDQHFHREAAQLDRWAREFPEGTMRTRENSAGARIGVWTLTERTEDAVWWLWCWTVTPPVIPRPTNYPLSHSPETERP